MAALQVSQAMGRLRALRRRVVTKLVFNMIMNGALIYFIIQQPGLWWTITSALLIPFHLFHAGRAIRQLTIADRLVYSEKLPPQLQQACILQAIARLWPLTGKAGKKYLEQAASFVQPVKNV